MPASSANQSVWWKRKPVIGGAIGAAVLLVVVVVLLTRGGKPDAQADTAGAGDKTDPNPAPPKPLAELSFPELVEKCEPSVARVQNRTGTGSGFVIRPGIVVTNFHVIDGDLVDKIEVTFPSAREGRDKKYKARLLHEDRKRDLAVLKVEGTTPTLALASADIRKGEKLYVIGSPGAGSGVSSNAATQGVLSNNDLRLGELQYYQTDAAINGGNSGGPVFNGRGEVIGVAVAKLIGKEGMNLAVPYTDVRAALEQAEKATPADQDRVAAEHNLTEVTERLLVTCAAYYFALDRIEDELLAAFKRKQELPPVLRAVKGNLSGLLDDDLRVHFRPVEDVFAAIVSSRDLPESQRGDKDVQALRDLYIEMRATFDAPSGTLEQFGARRKDYEDRFNAISERLKLKLGIAPKDRYGQSRTVVALRRPGG